MKARMTRIVVGVFVCLLHLPTRAGLERTVPGRPPPAATVSTGGATALAVDVLAGRLGAERYRTREIATRKLIEVGRRDADHRSLVRSAMNRRRRNHDPEVSQRALRILKALVLPRKPPRGVDVISTPS